MAPKTAKEVFALLRAFMENQKVRLHEKRDLWCVLTALRGPDDSGSDETKNATTAIVRHAVFGEDCLADWGVISHEDAEHYAEKRRLLELEGRPTQWHFWSHVRSAFEALGLGWNESNLNKKEG